jgi:hypothetical protein
MYTAIPLFGNGFMHEAIIVMNKPGKECMLLLVKS